MKTRLSIKGGLVKIRRYCDGQRYDRALAEVNRLLLKSPDNPSLLVLRAELIQLQNDADGSPTLADARADLERAVGLDDQSPNALIELGFFLFAVEDDPEAALGRFQQATKLCRRLITQSLVGQADVLMELGRSEGARLCLMEAKCIQSQNGNSSTSSHLKEIQDRLNSLARAGRIRLAADRS